MRKILFVLGFSTLIFSASAYISLPEEPTNCLRIVGDGSVYQLVIPGACYYNLQLEGDVWTCNSSNPGLCLNKFCFTGSEGCSFHPYENPIII